MDCQCGHYLMSAFYMHSIISYDGRGRKGERERVDIDRGVTKGAPKHLSSE